MKKLLIALAVFLSVGSFVSPSQPLVRLPLNLNLPDDPFWEEDANEANSNKNHFEEPDDSVNYADYRYVGAHNAHSYHRFFQTVRQQDQTLLGQLTYGVRGLMWDTYDFNIGSPAKMRGPEGAKVCLSHGAPGFVAFTQKGHNSYQSLQYELRRLIEYMRINKKAVITLVLENYADLNNTVKDIIAVTKAANYDPILKKTDWNPVNQEWPTLGWMRQNNKRLVIFTQRGGNTSHTWRQFSYCIENQYSTINELELCSQREESKAATNGRKLVIFNNFKNIAVTQATRDTKDQVYYNTVKRIVTNCQVRSFANKRLFNGYFADRIIDSCNDLYENKQRTVFEYVNILNRSSNKSSS